MSRWNLVKEFDSRYDLVVTKAFRVFPVVVLPSGQFSLLWRDCRLLGSRLVSYLKVDCNVKQKGRRFFIPWQRWERDIDFSRRNQTRQVDGLLRLDLGKLVARLQHTQLYIHFFYKPNQCQCM